ncbi:MAG TPA: ergothioneine biosynthesis protein EgtB, partial [Gemmatimonadaceae bacterium]|nr:ergothioneine biosynthesis protein EgtB [Gemmatimonadaceae bacterium]
MAVLTPPVAVAERLAEVLEEARTRTLRLIAPVAADDLVRQHDPLMSPIVWDLGHITQFEALWLLRNAGGRVERGEMPGIYDPFAHPRSTRGSLALPTVRETLATMARTRDLVLERLPRLDWSSDDPLLRGGYVVHMVAQHEHQHGETVLQTLRLKTGAPYAAPRRWAIPRGTAVDAAMVRVPAGAYPVGTDDRTWAYDNERPRHHVHLAAFEIDRAPVTNAEYARFVNEGGYARAELWSEEGWRWRMEADVAAPKHWRRDGAGWRARTFDRDEPLPPDHPVCHVCWFEAEAYARWAGKRLPSEVEWEVAATWDPATASARRYPWGDEPPTPELANMDQLRFGTTPVGAFPRNVSPLGCVGMIGDVWEWTSSDFTPYPGYATFPYREYSEVFFGPTHKVLRGGAWATRAHVARATFR